MATYGEAIPVLYPDAALVTDWLVHVGADGAQVLAVWNAAKLGPPPTAAAVAAMTAADLEAARVASRRTAAAALLDAITGDGVSRRAVVGALVDEINTLRGWLVSLKAAVAAATSLANLQTRVAALPNTPDRTLAQARAAVAAKLSSGDADS